MTLRAGGIFLINKCLCVSIDILGFKSLVIKNTLEDIKNKYLKVLNESFYNTLHYKAHFQTEVTLEELNAQDVCNIVWFSDSIFIFAENDSDQTIYWILSTLSGLLFFANLGLTTNLRCGVSYGEVFLDYENQIYFGQPIIDAYCLEEKQEWSGGALTQSACNRVNQLAPQYLDEINERFIIDYNVPIKKNSKILTKAINWTTGVHNYKPVFNWKTNKRNPSLVDWMSNTSICKKYRNTKKFHNKICTKCRIKQKQESHEIDLLPGFIDK
jgi:hypothetical protein